MKPCHNYFHSDAKAPPKLSKTCRKFWVIYNKFVGSNSFLTKLGLKVKNIEPIKLAHILTSKYQIMTSQLLTSFIRKMLNFRIVLFFISTLKELYLR